MQAEGTLNKKCTKLTSIVLIGLLIVTVVMVKLQINPFTIVIVECFSVILIVKFYKRKQNRSLEGDARFETLLPLSESPENNQAVKDEAPIQEEGLTIEEPTLQLLQEKTGEDSETNSHKEESLIALIETKTVPKALQNKTTACEPVCQVDSFKAFQRENELISKTLNKAVHTETDESIPKRDGQEQFIQLSLDEYFTDNLTVGSCVTESGDTLSLFEQQVYNQISSILIQHKRDITKIKPKNMGVYFDIVGEDTLVRFKLQGRKHYLLTHLSTDEVMAKALIAECPSKNEKYQTRVPLFSMYVLEQLTDYILQRYDEVC